MTKLPAWARWNEAAADTPWTVGIEEEVMLLDPRRTWSLANRIDAVLAALPPGITAHASAETRACVVELRTAPHSTVAAAGAELALLRCALDEALRDTLELRAATAGTHPTATPSDVALSDGARYWHIGATMGALAQREPTMAQHIHVAVPDAASAVRALNGLRSELPLLLGLSAHSSGTPLRRVEMPDTVLARAGFQLRLDTHADLLDVPPRGHPPALRQLPGVRERHRR